MACPQYGAPLPAKKHWDGWGFEYKSKAMLLGLPWLHISFKDSPARCPAKGIVAIGQFACGIFTLSQFGIGLVSISQFTVAGFALAQFALGYALIAQMGFYIDMGQTVKNILIMLSWQQITTPVKKETGTPQFDEEKLGVSSSCKISGFDRTGVSRYSAGES